jgi:hypothetical protein
LISVPPVMGMKGNSGAEAAMGPAALSCAFQRGLITS